MRPTVASAHAVQKCGVRIAGAGLVVEGAAVLSPAVGCWAVVTGPPVEGTGGRPRAAADALPAGADQEVVMLIDVVVARARRAGVTSAAS